jgi:hypothetical protein
MTETKTARFLKNDGGDAEYYKLPEGATDIMDLIEAKNMTFSRGNICKAVWRAIEDSPQYYLRDMKKIKWFAEREIERVENLMRLAQEEKDALRSMQETIEGE